MNNSHKQYIISLFLSTFSKQIKLSFPIEKNNLEKDLIRPYAFASCGIPPHVLDNEMFRFYAGIHPNNMSLIILWSFFKLFLIVEDHSERSHLRDQIIKAAKEVGGIIKGLASEQAKYFCLTID